MWNSISSWQPLQYTVYSIHDLNDDLLGWLYAIPLLLDMQLWPAWCFLEPTLQNHKHDIWHRMRLKQAWLLCSCERRPSHHPPVGRTNILVMLMEGGEYLYILQSAEENRGEGERLWMECGYLWGCCWRMIYDSPHMGKREWIRIVLR